MSSKAAIPLRLRSYVRSRAGELGTITTRASSEPLADWCLRRIRLDGKPFTFNGHEYLRQIYDDTAGHIVLCKAAQIGGTVWAILRSIHSCIMGLGVGYYFPTRTDVMDFSRSRVGPLLAQNPFLSKMIKDTDTIGLKQINGMPMYLRGMESKVGMKSIAVDLVVFDELDEATPEAKTMAKERLSHSDYRRLIELSNPSLPNFGIDEAFAVSDQRHWHLKCPHCGEWTAPDKAFPRKLNEEVRIILPRSDGSFYLACPHCDAELDLAQGEWVADFPDRPTHGYLISQLFSSKVDPGEILKDYQTTRHPDRFYNLKIGIAWADLQNRLDVASVLACCGDAGMLEESTDGCTMGVDCGKDLHVVISRWGGKLKDKRHVVYIGVHQEYEELDQLMKRFNVRRCVIDAMPEIHITRAFAKRFPWRVWCNYFQDSQRGAYRWDNDQFLVYENRTEALDASRQVIRAKEIVLPRTGPVLQEFAEHMTADVKRLDEDPQTGAKSYRYWKTGINHFSFAFTYDCIAWSKEPKGGDYGRAFASSGTGRHWDPIMDMDTSSGRRPPPWEPTWVPITRMRF